MKTQPEFRLHVTDDDRLVWRHEPTGRLLPIVSGGDGDEDQETAPTEVEVPEDLSTLDDDQLGELIGAAETAIQTMADNPAPTSDEVVAVQQLNRALRDMKIERTNRADEAARRKAEYDAAVSEALGQASDAGEGDAETEGDDGDDGEDGADAETSGDNAEEESAEAKPAKREKLRIPVTDRVGAEGTRKSAGKLNLNTGDLARRAPNPGLADRSPMKITAAGDIPRFFAGQELTSLEEIARAATNRAKSLGVSAGTGAFVPLCTIEREFPLWLDETMPDNEVLEAWNGFLGEYNANTVAGMEALVAAGGWCAPSEIDYSLFNIAGVSGLLDLPTFGVSRGGIRHVQNGGLSLHDFFAQANGAASGLPTNATMPWQWTETDDQAAATGSPTKKCLRPPCPTFVDDRLTAYGVCVLAGNLTEEAYPELIRDFIAKSVVAHARAMSRRHILAAVAIAGAATIPVAGAASAINAALGGLDLNAVDYREKHGMADDAVLEVVAPAWIRGTWRSDLAKKNGLDRLDAADAYLMSLFDTRNLRLQFVSEWQTRGSSAIANTGGTVPTNWPATGDVMMWAPGTIARGNGPALDLGVVRDSVLNAANDHTAAWSEESTLVAKMGHEARLITLATVANGATGAATAQTGA